MAARPNVFDPVFDEEVTRYEESGFRSRRSRLGYQAGCERLGVSLWELEPGPMGPLHYHFGNEELLAVLSGRPTLRTPAGSRALAEGEVAAFPRGPHGAHAIGNDSDGPVRLLLFSEMRGPDVIVYPEQELLGGVEAMSSPERGGMAIWLRTDSAVEYHEPDEPDPSRAPAAQPDAANILQPEFDASRDQPGFTYRRAKLAQQAGAERLGVSLYEIPPGQATFPYHVHTANEELLIVLDGTPSLRTPGGWRELEPGELVAFLVGEEGAHQVANRSQAPARVLVASTMIAPEVNLYPDSGKLMAATRAPGAAGAGFQEAYRRERATDYWDGEQPPSGGD
jgi:uncharacterized cupin superfamily protein